MMPICRSSLSMRTSNISLKSEELSPVYTLHLYTVKTELSLWYQKKLEKVSTSVTVYKL